MSSFKSIEDRIRRECDQIGENKADALFRKVAVDLGFNPNGGTWWATDEYWDFEGNENYADEWVKYNPKYKDWVDPLTIATSSTNYKNVEPEHHRLAWVALAEACQCVASSDNPDAHELVRAIDRFSDVLMGEANLSWKDTLTNNILRHSQGLTKTQIRELIDAAVNGRNPDERLFVKPLHNQKEKS